MRGRKDIGRLNRLKFCDHSAAFDSFDIGYDCNGMSAGGAGDEDTGDGGSGGVDATGRGRRGIGQGPPPGRRGAPVLDRHGRRPGSLRHRQEGRRADDERRLGGAGPTTRAAGTSGELVTCKDKLGVMNYMLPMKFMEWAGKNDVGRRAQQRRRWRQRHLHADRRGHERQLGARRQGQRGQRLDPPRGRPSR